METYKELVKEFGNTDIHKICMRIVEKMSWGTRFQMLEKLSVEDLMDNIRLDLDMGGKSEHSYWVHTEVGNVVILVEFALDGETIVVRSRKLIEGK